jgi:hypothetical protein
MRRCRLSRSTWPSFAHVYPQCDRCLHCSCQSISLLQPSIPTSLGSSILMHHGIARTRAKRLTPKRSTPLAATPLGRTQPAPTTSQEVGLPKLLGPHYHAIRLATSSSTTVALVDPRNRGKSSHHGKRTTTLEQEVTFRSTLLRQKRAQVNVCNRVFTPCACRLSERTIH